MTKYYIIKIGNLYIDHFYGGSFGLSLSNKEKAKTFDTEHYDNAVIYLNDNNIPFKVIEVTVTEVEMSL